MLFIKVTELYGAQVRKLVTPFNQSGISDNFLDLDSLVGLEYDHVTSQCLLILINIWGGIIPVYSCVDGAL